MSDETHDKAKGGEGGQFKPETIPAQSQSQPGLEKDMQPASEPTKLEGSDDFVEYLAAGKLKGKTALITGGDSGIGRSIAVLYAREGADVTVVYLRDEQEDAEETKKLVEKEGKQCLLFPGDLMQAETCKSAVDAHFKQYKSLDILVNNAGKQIKCEAFEDISLDDVESTFRSNVLSAFAVTKYALPHMKKGSSIINSTSTVAFRGTGDFVDYASSKGAITTFTRSLAKQLMPKGIRVNAIAPGPVHTPLQAASRKSEELENFGKNSNIGRPGQPSELAPSYVFLASNDASLFYGQILHAYPIGD